LALRVARQSGEALTALHRKGFVHGDVKPDNIRLLDEVTAKIIDLGFAHRPGENAALIEAGYVLGTPDYMSPESCAFIGDPDERSDIYSLGVTLFEMLTGKLPFSPGTTVQTLLRHRSEHPMDIREYDDSLPPALVNLVHRMLAHDATDRPLAPAVVQQLIALEMTTWRHRRSA
jgi:serine/threonine protein kinase